MSKVSKTTLFETAENEAKPAERNSRSTARLSSALDFDALDEASKSGGLTADELYDAVDRDGDGRISRGEFQNMFGVLKKHVHSELVKERQTTMRADQAEGKASVATRRLKAAFCLMSILASE